jgi:hypothetical protein
MAYPYSSLQDPYSQMQLVFPSDTSNIPEGLTRGVICHITTAGNVVFTMANGADVTFDLPLGLHHLPLRIIRVKVTGATAVGQTYACY